MELRKAQCVQRTALTDQTETREAVRSCLSKLGFLRSFNVYNEISENTLILSVSSRWRFVTELLIAAVTTKLLDAVSMNRVLDGAGLGHDLQGC